MDATKPFNATCNHDVARLPPLVLRSGVASEVNPWCGLLLIENLSQYPASRLETQSALQFLSASKRAHHNKV